MSWKPAVCPTECALRVMSNPARAPTELTAVQLELAQSLPMDVAPEGWQQASRMYGNLETVKQALSVVDMELCRTILLTRSLCSQENVRNSAKAPMALAAKGVTTMRQRSASAVRAVASAVKRLPDEGVASRALVVAAARRKVYVNSGGVEGTINRLVQYLPRKGAVPPPRPVTTEEANAALRRCGLSLAGVPDEFRRPYPLVVADGSQLRVNPHSDNGFPVLGRWSDPGAAELCHGLALTLRRELVARAGDVAGYVRELMEHQPELVALRGKAKADYYQLEKVAGGMLRFYNAFPRHVALNMQMATQPFERLARHIQVGSESRSGIGLTLVRGGAQDLVDALQQQLDEAGQAYVHVGDDSWVLAMRNGVLVQFALDCSSFDLTQHADVTEAVHEVLRRELATIDAPAADLWHTFARERLVVLVLSLVVRLRHAGPSGMPLQSKVNDMLMDVMINRTLTALDGHTEEAVAAAVERVGSEMGFRVRLEQYQSGWGVTEISEMLRRTPFLFIGYHFWATDSGKVLVHCDVPRTFSQLTTPTTGWKRAKGEFDLAEAMRLGSIAMNMGMPPPELEAAFAEVRQHAISEVERQLLIRGDVQSDKLIWAVQDNPFAAAAEPSLSGLLRVLRRPPATLWAPVELPATVTFIPLGASWAEQIEQEERSVLIGLGISPTALERPAPAPAVLPQRFPNTRAPTHPATSRNAGRPPPTARWHPPRAPRQVLVRGTRRTRRGAVEEYEDSDSVYSFAPTEMTFGDDSESSPSDAEWEDWGFR